MCCPSRASIFSGRYAHNHATTNNSMSGGCYSSIWQEHIEPHTFPVQLQNSGYRTFYAGKYLNRVGFRLKMNSHNSHSTNTNHVLLLLLLFSRAFPFLNFRSIFRNVYRPVIMIGMDYKAIPNITITH